MTSPSRSTLVLLSAALVAAVLAFSACALAALNDAEFRALEKQRSHLAAPTLGVEVMQRFEVKTHVVHASHVVRQDAVSA
jgi:hypothetical protein